MSFYEQTQKDIALDANNDLKFEDGDLVIEPSEQVHIDHILSADKGNWRQFPVLGVGIRRYLNSTGGINDRGELIRKIRLNLEFDNFKVISLKIENNNGKTSINIDAKKTK